MELNTTILIRLFQFGVFFAFCYSECRGNQIPVTIKTTLTSHISFIKTEQEWNCLLHRPSSFTQKEKWPLIIFLHNEKFRGSDLELLKRQGPPLFLDTDPDFPFVVVSPQLPAQGVWEPKELMPLVEEAIKLYKIDPLRVYITGVSEGAAGAWDLAALDQKKFAAIVPVCGFSAKKNIAKLVNDLPIKAIHGSNDRVSSITGHQRLIGEVIAAGGNKENVTLTEIPNGTHGTIVFPAYADRNLYQWMLSHSRVVKPIAEAREVTQIRPKFPKPQGAIFKKGSQGNLLKKDPANNKPKPLLARIHKVTKGDTLFKISNKFGVTIQAIQKKNGLKSDVIQIGQELQIPEPLER